MAEDASAADVDEVATVATASDASQFLEDAAIAAWGAPPPPSIRRDLTAALALSRVASRAGARIISGAFEMSRLAEPVAARPGTRKFRRRGSRTPASSPRRGHATRFPRGRSRAL